MTTNFTVTSENGSSGLNSVIGSIDVGGSNAATDTNYTITVNGTIDLTSALLAIDLMSGSTLTISGGGHTIDGMGD